ncbi:14.7 kDa ribonuclease H-like protein [Macadamia integrifolia]|uniref:14.7 kDa ribonuclease H-like protein n=1 Tax=Macadamia integrifolia TaxID=60698 RepID=UPI001C4EFD97|nr:14.7 kDa ribonuclease H-like protein [Macadamia integrifolia]
MQDACGSLVGVIKSANDLICCRQLGLSALPGKPLSKLEVFCCRPGFSWTKLNVDGCSSGNPGNSGAEGVFGNHKGLVVGSFKKFLGVHSNYYTEFTALMEGIFKAKELQVEALWIELDSAAVVVALQSKSIPWFIFQDWMSVKDYLNSVS